MKQLAKKLIKQESFDLAGLKVQRKDEPRKKLEFEDGNLVVPRYGISHTSNSCSLSDSTRPAAQWYCSAMLSSSPFLDQVSPNEATTSKRSNGIGNPVQS